MKIISLEASNILRLTAAAVTVDDDQSVVTVSGQNGHGKSSLLNAIAMAIGGKKLCPPEPLRRGKDKGHIVVDLGDYIVTRKFWRDFSDAQHPTISSSLTVASHDGAIYKSPQALLDKLVSDLTFDPLAFLELSQKDQREHVRRLVGLDFTALDQQRQTAVAHASEAQTVLKLAERDVDAGDFYPDASAEGIDVAQVLAALADAERLAAVAAEAEKALEGKRREVVNLDMEIRDTKSRIEVLRATLQEVEQLRADAVVEGRARREEGDTARAAVPDTSALRQQLADATAINAQVQANVRHTSVLQSRDEARAELAEAKRATVAIDVEKQRMLEAATFPVEGLAFSDEGLTFQNLPFEQASYAQQLRVAVAMGLATTPALKVLLIKHGNALDAKSLRLLTDLAEQAGAQVWLERVAETADGVSIFIEDGMVIEAHA